MKYFSVYLVASVMLMSATCIAQKTDKGSHLQSFKRLSVGDTVQMENIVFDNVRNYPGGKAKLSDFKGKYIILDFWTRLCGSCIAAFPKMEKLQQQFKDDIQILLVTKNSEEELASLFKNSPNVKNTKLPMIIGDPILATQIFPHATVPYHVWLDRSGKVVATTWDQETNIQNLKDLIAGKPMDHIMLRRETYVEWDEISRNLYKEMEDPKISLLKIGNQRYLNLLKFYVPIPGSLKANKMATSVSSAYFDIGLNKLPSTSHYSLITSYNMDVEELHAKYSGGYFLLKNDGDTLGFRIKNLDLDKLYKFAYESSEMFGPNSSSFNKLVIDGRAKELYEEITDTTNMKRHLINNSFCYESSLPIYTLGRAKRLLKQDLARFFGLTGHIEERPVKHIILTRLNNKNEKRIWMRDQNINKENSKTQFEKDGFVFRNVPFLAVKGIIWVNNRETTDPIIVDETGLSDMQTPKNLNHLGFLKTINMKLKCKTFKCTTENIPLIRSELAKYGIGLVEEMRIVKTLVLKESI